MPALVLAHFVAPERGAFVAHERQGGGIGDFRYRFRNVGFLTTLLSLATENGR